MEYIVLEAMEVKSWHQIREIEYDGNIFDCFFFLQIYKNYFSYDWECVLDHPVLEEDHSILSFRNGLKKPTIIYIKYKLYYYYYYLLYNLYKLIFLF